MLDKKRKDFEEREELLFIEHRGDELQIKEWASEEEGEVKKERDLLAYSSKETLERKDFGHLQLEEIEKVKELVMGFSRRMAVRLLRRWKRGKRGNQIDFRKSIRQSIKYGGEEGKNFRRGPSISLYENFGLVRWHQYRSCPPSTPSKPFSSIKSKDLINYFQ